MGLFPFCIALVQIIQIFDLLLHNHKYTNVGKHQNENRAEKRQDGKDEGIHDKPCDKQQTAASKRQEPDKNRRLGDSRVGHVGTIPHGRSNGQIPVNGQDAQTQKGSGTAHKVNKL